MVPCLATKRGRGNLTEPYRADFRVGATKDPEGKTRTPQGPSSPQPQLWSGGSHRKPQSPTSSPPTSSTSLLRIQRILCPASLPSALATELSRIQTPTRDLGTPSALSPTSLQPRDEAHSPLLTCHLNMPSMTKHSFRSQPTHHLTFLRAPMTPAWSLSLQGAPPEPAPEKSR